jgi:hypothetical protein
MPFQINICNSILQLNQRESLIKIRKALVDFLVAVDKETNGNQTVKVPKILGMPSMNQLSKFWSELLAIAPLGKLLEKDSDLVFSILATIETLKANERDKHDELLGIEKILFASFKEDPKNHSNLLMQLLELIEKERAIKEKGSISSFNTLHFIYLITLVHSILGPLDKDFDEDFLIKSFKDLQKLEGNQLNIDDALESLRQANAYRSRLSVLK